MGIISAIKAIAMAWAEQNKLKSKFSDAIQIREARNHVKKCFQDVQRLRTSTRAAITGELDFALKSLADAQTDYELLRKKIYQHQIEKEE